MQKDIFITYAKRTPVGKFMGGLKTLSAPKLSSYLIKDFKSACDLEIDQVILGQVLTAGSGQAPARQAALWGGMKESTPTMSINRVCGSGLQAVILARQALMVEPEAQLILAGGQESMSQAPHLLIDSREGFKYGDKILQDHIQKDGLWDVYNNQSMGQCAESCAKQFLFTREMQDAFAHSSYTKAQEAWNKKYFQNEVLPITVHQPKQSLEIATDEEPFASDLNKIFKLKPAFLEGGTITAANASSINDGAALLAVMSEEGLKNSQTTKPMAKILGVSMAAKAPMEYTIAPILCVEKLLKKTGKKAHEIDLWEINEAFSVVTMAAIKSLELDPLKVNVHGGAVSIGHPLGASGARILVTLLHALKLHGKKYGVATLCIGGGEAVAILIENLLT